MKTNYLRLLILFLVIAVLTGACKKNDDDDNGTPEPDEKDGKITFYTNSGDCGPIQLQLNDENIGPLSAVYSETSGPTCGSANTITVDVNTGVHNYHAEDTCNHIWEGSIIINKGDCKVRLLSR